MLHVVSLQIRPMCFLNDARNLHVYRLFVLYLCVVILSQQMQVVIICRILCLTMAALVSAVLFSGAASPHRHLVPASQKLTYLLVSQACLQASPVPQLTQPPWGGGQTFSPAAKGELLMAAVMAMAQPSQHTQGSATLLKALLSSFALAAAAQSAIAKVSKPCCVGVMSRLHSLLVCLLKRQSW